MINIRIIGISNTSNTMFFSLGEATSLGERNI